MSVKFNLDIWNLSEVIKIDKDNKKIKIENKKNGEIYEEGYDVLVLLLGVNLLKLLILGIEECDNLFIFRNIFDIDKIKLYVDNKKIKNVVIVGGGFIGFEMVENFYERGINIMLVEVSN